MQLIYASYRFIDDGINLSGMPLLVLQFTTAVIEACALGWVILLVLQAIGEAIIRHRTTRADAVEAQLIRIVVRLLAIIGLIYLALYLADSFGIPAAPLIASLGVGGLAIALAVRPTLENIVGGFILFADKPVRVGEFCRFGDKMGTVEEIGLRSTRIRGIDRTVITVPNADFAQLEIVNFTRRDRMLMQTTLGLRYETTPDQLRYVLTKLRELFVAHPKVSPEPARARFTGFGESSLNIEIFLYVLSADFNEFLGIAEDVNLRIMAIVTEAGTGFSFPSQTAYLARDHGLDAERTEAVEAEVQAWRASGALPFPGLAPERITTLDGSLDFPPEGSVHQHQVAEAAPVGEAAKRSRWGFRRSDTTKKR
jgi:MscS family membrane protein